MKNRVIQHGLMGNLGYLVDRLCHPEVSYPTLGYPVKIWRLGLAVVYGPNRVLCFVKGVRLGSMLTIAITLTPVAALFYLIKFRFISVDLKQVGSVSYLDQILRYNALNGITNPRRLLVARSRYTDANTVALDLYKGKVTYIFSPFLKLMTSPFFMNPLLQQNSFRFDSSQTSRTSKRGRKVIAHDVHQEYKRRFGRPLVALGEAERERAQSELRVFLQGRTRFVALHVRDSGYYNDPEKNIRNGDIWSYEPAIRYLIEQGYLVFRMGDPNMVPIESMKQRCGPSLIDYAHSAVRSPLVDCFLISECDFYIGLASGIWAVAIAFEKPTVLVNFYSAATGLGFSPMDLTTFKTLRYSKDSSLVPLSLYFNPPFSRNPSRRILEEMNVYLEENTSDEILDTVREFLHRKSNSMTRIQSLAKDMMQTHNFAWGAAGNFSNTVLLKFFSENQDESRPV